KKLVGCALLSGLSSANVYVFGAAGPFIGIHLLHVPPALYGLLGLTPFIGTLIGSVIVVRLTHVSALRLIKGAFLLELLAAIVMLLFFICHVFNLWTLLIPMSFICMGHRLLAGTALSLAMQQTEDRANGSAVMNFSSMSMPVV